MTKTLDISRAKSIDGWMSEVRICLIRGVCGREIA